ncbi:Serine/threonine-protein kinase ssp1 [Elsinoe australis]|uniref:Serine/threonine-protein kinase ssp1 n=1 Tax=Elsinoe australis TaxID=40998 RepID=A0A2P8AFT0_9PEZI|nr:Serine/threonine-protein kinase ssp1 [Elsinoe australis]
MARLPSPDRTPAPQFSAPTSASGPRTNLLTYNLWKMSTKDNWLYVNDHSVVMKKSVNTKVFVQKISRAYGWNPSMRNERSILQQLDHKHVVKLFLDRPGSQPPTDNLDLEFINGSDLSRLRTVEGYCKLEIVPLIQLLRNLPEVIQYLFKQKVEHNDLKPEKILMTRRGIKVVDFELAKIGKDHANPVYAGSPGYVQPGLMRGSSPVQWPGKRDVYALGIICLFALRLIKLPKPDLFTISKIDVDGPDREKMDEWLGHISTIKTELPHNLELIKRTLTRHPNERVDSTELVAKDYSFNRSHLRGVIDKALKLRSKNKTHGSGGDSEEV